MSESLDIQGKQSVTDEQARLKAVELVANGTTIERAELQEDMAAAVRGVLQNILGRQEAQTEPAEEGKPDTVVAEAADRTDAATDKLNRLKQNLTAQYDEMDIQGSKPPFENVLNKFGKNKLEIADTYDTPYLLMLPVMKNNKITGYRPVIAEGKQDMDPYEGDDLKANLEDRIATRWEKREDCESGMTKIIYEPLFKAAKKAGKPIDRRFWTISDGDYKKGDPGVLIANSLVGQQGSIEDRAVFPNVYYRFRSAVVGDVLTI